MKVFISYSTDNAALADALSNILQALHPNVSVGVMKNIPFGVEWSKGIQGRLESADVLIALAGNIPRREFAYTGVEIGYFLKAIEQTPNGSTGAPRRVIPVYLTDAPPDVLSRTQGPNFHDFLLRLGSLDFSKKSEDIAADITIDQNDPAYRLLATLEAVAVPDGTVNPSRDGQLIQQARNLYRAIIEVARSQPVSEVQPKGKFIVHLPPNTWDLAKANIGVEGPLVRMLNVADPTGQYTWEQVATSLKSEGTADEWREALQALLRMVQGDRLDEGDQLVSSPGLASILVRMFVSRSVVYYDGRRDVHIYVVQLLKDKDYGDPFTTTLWKGIGSCIKLRFMLLEGQEDFSAVVIRSLYQGSATKVREYALELKTELYAAERLWRIAGLDDPKNLVRIMGKTDAEQVTTMIGEWWKRRNGLVAATAGVLNADDSAVEQATELWITAIEGFRAGVSAFNGTLLLRMLEQLEETVKKVAADDPAPDQSLSLGAATAALP